MTAMTRRAMMALLTTLPLLRGFDLLKVTASCGGHTHTWSKPRAVAEKRLKNGVVFNSP